MKKRLIALLLAGAMCFGSTVSYAAEANDEKHAPTPEIVQENTTLEVDAPETFAIAKEKEKKTGWVCEEEGWYYYDADGEKVTGWLKLGSTWYYLDGDNAEYPGLMVENKRQEINGYEYWFTASGAMRTGWIYKGSDCFYADNSGALADGWAYVDGYWFYFDGADKAMVRDCRMMINGEEYWFEPGGYMKTGWIYESGNWYFAKSYGALANGWAYDNGSWFYFDATDSEAPNSMVRNCRKEINGKEYWFEPGGYMKTGWIYEGNDWYYATSSGALAEGWEEVNGSRYYFDANNAECPKSMAADEKLNIDGQDYWFAPSGYMRTGWVYDDNEWYYIQNDGSKTAGWLEINGYWYYMDANNTENPNAMVKDCKMTIGGYEFRFGPSGDMQTGWLYDHPDWYYVKPNGYLASGWYQVGDYWYYMDPANDNKMVKDQWKYINGSWYYFYGGGSMATGWLSLNGEWYYLRSSGSMATGWLSVGGVWYYLYSDGSMAKNTTIDGYKLGPNGALLNYGPMGMYNKIAALSSPTGYLIAVDRNNRQVGIYQGAAGNWGNVATWSCTVGAPSTPTITGTYYVGDKGYYFDSNEGFRCYYYTQISGAYLFHSVLYYRNGSLADGRLGMALSHGCVRLHINNAKWIYNNIPRHTKIVIY